MEEKIKECSNCGIKLGPFYEELYEYKGNLYCWECLISELEDDKIITTEFTKHYYLNDEWIGDDTNFDDVIDTVLSNYKDEIKVVKE